MQADQDAPFWLSPPITNTVPRDSKVTFRAVAGGRDVRYVWLSNGVPLAQVTTPSLSLVATEATSAARFSLVASNAFGMSTNGTFRVRLATGPTTYQPRGKAKAPWNEPPNVLDLIAIGNHLRSNPSLVGLPLALADADGNGTVDHVDLALVHDAILGRTNLGLVSKLATDDSNNNGLPDYRDWLIGLSPTTNDADGDGVEDAVELRSGTDPLDPRSFVPYNGFFVAHPQVSVLVAQPDAGDAGLFVATPPTSVVVLGRDDANDLGLFAATPSASVLVAQPDAGDAGLFVATPPVVALLKP